MSYAGGHAMGEITAAAQTVARRVTEAPDHWVATLARLGYATIGVVYLMIGTLATQAALGTGGAIGGAALGDALDEGMTEGLPKDELFIYEDALRQGRSVVIAFVHPGRQVDVFEG